MTGHVHSYESTGAMTGNNATSVGTITDDSHGTHHIMFGGAGAPLDGFDETEPWIIYRGSTHGYAILTATATSLRGRHFAKTAARWILSV